ncbi:MAG: hypothetical protein KF868_18130 [Acidobacteria bacterium]|nr:hypothetical protein [Acidobacteriota bacterium]MCW5967915.1 hypothetical protein [Blastocatellales bacterium]
MGDLPVPPFTEALFEWQTVLQFMQTVVGAGAFVLLVLAIGAIAWLTLQQSSVRHSHNPFSLL